MDTELTRRKLVGATASGALASSLAAVSGARAATGGVARALAKQTRSMTPHSIEFIGGGRSTYPPRRCS